MGRETPLNSDNPAVSLSVRAYTLSLALAGAGIVVAQALHARPIGLQQFTAFALFTAMSIIAQRSPAVSPEGQVQYSWGHALHLAAVIVLSPLLATMVVAVNHSLTLLRLERRHWRWPGRKLVGRVFNASAALLGVGLTATVLGLSRAELTAHGLPAILALGPTVLTFVALQTLPVAWVVALDQGVPLRRTGALSPDGLAGDAAMALVGAMVGWFYALEPLSLLLSVPPLLIVHRWLDKLQHSYADVRALNGRLAAANTGLIETLATVIDARDSSTYRHSYHVARYAVAIGGELGLSADDLEELRRGALIHDIGKVGIPEAILFKPGRLDDAEFAVIKRHTTIGYRIVSQVPGLAHLAEIVRQHHERWSGGGYPLGQAGEAIPLSARIVSVADTLDVLLSDRPYRAADSLAAALKEIQRCSGGQFDPDVVVALERVIAREGEGWFSNSALTAASKLV